MAEGVQTRPVALRRRRQEVIDLLTEAFAQGDLEVEDFEERVDQAHRASDLQALQVVVRDLEPAGGEDEHPAPVQDTRMVIPSDRPDSRWAVSIMGGLERRGTWRVPRKLRVVTCMGGAEIDLRDVVLPPGETEITVTCLMGGVEIIVPPDLAVECDGIAVMGGFEHVDRATAEPDPEAPLLRVRGFVMMGGVDIETRLPGESARQARKRRRKEDRQKRKLRKKDQRQLASGK